MNWAVYLSLGSTLSIGGSLDNNIIGATWVFVRSGNSWSQQGTKLVGTGDIGGARQGSSTALSADGNTLAVGGIIDNNNVGAVWIWIRNDTTWTQQAKLIPNDGIEPFFGRSVALSADGNTLAVGGLMIIVLKVQHGFLQEVCLDGSNRVQN